MLNYEVVDKLLVSISTHVNIWRAKSYRWRKVSTSGLIIVRSEFIARPNTTTANTPDILKNSSTEKSYLITTLSRSEKQN